MEIQVNDLIDATDRVVVRKYSTTLQLIVEQKELDHRKMVGQNEYDVYFDMTWLDDFCWLGVKNIVVFYRELHDKICKMVQGDDDWVECRGPKDISDRIGDHWVMEYIKRDVFHRGMLEAKGIASHE